MQKIDFYPSVVQKAFLAGLCVFLHLFLGGCGLHQPTSDEAKDLSCISKGWPHERSDLPVDPTLVFGTLENGLRYVIKSNGEPKGRVALYLNIQAGSLHETDEQRGLAHYLEHMLFNGTTHYPPGKLVEYFQSIGMGFGADTNAHTTFDETVYKLLLPSGDPDTLNEGLLVLADYARGALLLEEEVERERGIILAEKRTRDSAASRVSKGFLQFEFAGTRIAERDPIGTEETLKAANSKRLRSYYDTWYRPENMLVVLVGDTDPDQAARSISQYFSSLRAEEEQVDCFNHGRIQETGTDVFYKYEPDLGVTDIGISTLWNIEPQADTAGWEKIQLQNYVAASLLDNRLKNLVNAKDSPLVTARVYAGIFLRRFGYFSLSARTDASKWQQGLALLEQTLRQGVEQGITASELERVKREINADLDENVQTAQSRNSSKLAMEIISKLNRKEVILAPDQEKELYGGMLLEMTVADVEDALRRIWAQNRRVVKVAGTANLNEVEGEAEQEIRQVMATSSAVEVESWQHAKVIQFPYLEPLRQSEPIEQVVDHSDIAATTTILANGVRINVKKTDFKDQEVLLAIHFGKGQLSEPVPGLGKLAESVVHESGVGRLTRDQLDAALAGRNAKVKFSVGPESFFFSGKGLSNELELMLQLVHTTLADPAFRPEAYSRSMKQFAQMYSAMQSSVEGTMQLSGQRFFAGGDPRYGFPDKNTFMQLRLEQVEEWIGKAMQRADLEISVVGDVEPAKVVELVRRYLGGEKAGISDMLGKRAGVQFPMGKRKVLEVASSVDKAVVAVGWPTDDFWDISRTRRLSVLASVLEDRLRRTIREELGAVYSPIAYNYSSRADRGFGVLRCLLTIAPLQADLVRDKITFIANDLVQHGVEASELQRVVEPIKTSIKDLQRTNRYWLESVLALSSRHPEQLQWPLTIRTDFASITSKQINEFAGRYLRADMAAYLLITPLQQ